MKGNFTPTRHDNPCIVCDNTDGRCRQTEKIHLCMNVVDKWSARSLRGFQFLGLTKDRQWGKFIERDDSLSEQDRETQRLHWQQVKARRAAEEQQHHAAAMPSAERDRHYRKLLSQLTLHPDDRADLHRRGLTDKQIEAGVFRSVEQWQRLEVALPWRLPGVNLDSYSLNTQAGYLCPIRDVDGLIVGCQVRLRSAEQGGRYRWLSSRTKKRPNGATAHLSNGENPITVARPIAHSGWRLQVADADPSCTCHQGFEFFGTFEECNERYFIEKSTLDRSEEGGDRFFGCNCTFSIKQCHVIGMAEGVLKPYIASQRLGHVFVGAAGGQFTSSPETLKATLEKLSTESGLRAVTFFPDAGCLENQSVLKQYSATWKLVQELGYEVAIAWWGQFTKDDPDIDELEDFDELEFITTEQFWSLHKNRKFEQHKAANAKIQIELNSLTHEPTLRLNQQYLSDIHLPEKGGYLFISSPMGTGKTTQLANLIAEYRSRRPNGNIRSVGYRNGLLRQTGKKLEIPLLVDLDFESDHGKLTSVQVGKLPAAGLCINSLLRLDVDFLDGALLIFDEIDAILKNLLTSKLLKSKRAQIMAHLQRIVRHVLKTGGYVVAMEANLTDLSIDFLQGIGGTEHPMQLVCNEWSGQPWGVTLCQVSAATWMINIAKFLGRQVVVTDSQKFGEQLERLMRGSGKKIMRVDGKTAERDDVRALLANPDKWIKFHQPDILILSPTLESGGDIAIRSYFDRVAFNLCSLETRSQMQLLGRVRDPIPRVGVIGNPSNSDEVGRSLNPETIRDDLYRNAEALVTFTQLAQNLEKQSNSGDSEAKVYRDRLLALLDPAVDSPEGFWLDAYCKFKARENGARAAMAENLIAALKAAGHSIGISGLAGSKADSEIRRELREELEREEATATASADDRDLTPQMAREMLESMATTEADRFAARKALLRDSLPGVELTEEFIFKNVIQERGAALKAATLLWQCQNVEIAKELDRRAFSRELEKPFVYVPDLKTKSLKANLLNRSGLVELIGDRVYTEEDEGVQKFKQWALWNRFEIKRLLGMTVSDKLSAITIFCKFARKLGYELDNCKRGGRGQQVRVYHITNLEDGDRTAILEALTRKYAELAPTDAQNVSSSDTVSTTFLSITPLREVDTKTVDTGGAASDADPWLTAESLADVRMWRQWGIPPKLCEELGITSAEIPQHVIERAIA